jgi:hypothetical protein
MVLGRRSKGIHSRDEIKSKGMDPDIYSDVKFLVFFLRL